MIEHAELHLQEFLKARIRAIPDYPVDGIVFWDVTTLLGDREGFTAAIDALAARYTDDNIDLVAGIEARGFILGGAVADRLGAGFVPVRKQGKLPAETFAEEYELEYGRDAVEIHCDAVDGGCRVLLVDDLIATGGTAIASLGLLRRTGATVVGAAFIIDLPDLGGAARLAEQDCPVRALCAYPGA